MIGALCRRMLSNHDLRLVAKFAYRFGWQGMRAVSRFRRRMKRGETFPAFTFLSITNACNLRCQGCWVTPTSPPRHLGVEVCNHIIDAGRGRGCFFYGLLGGEPLMHPNLLDIIAAHPDCYFQVFSNGTLIDADIAREFRRLGNVTPLISIEGSETVSDVRRGGHEVYSRTLEGLERCREQRLITGVACSICQSNLADLASESFIESLLLRGIAYLWYYIYRPVGPRPSPELALTLDQVVALRRFLVDARCRYPLAMVDAYWDAEGRALCPAATGISHHINPFGDIEPCPIIQFACDRLAASSDVVATFQESDFLERFRCMATARTRGCILLEDPALLADFVVRSGARDSSGRGTAFEELSTSCPRVSHNMGGREIPEKHWFYRFAKKHWFFGFGAYG